MQQKLDARKICVKTLANIFCSIKFIVKSFVVELEPEMLSVSDEPTDGHREIWKQ